MLPEYFIIKNNQKSPLWKQFIGWLNSPERGNGFWTGNDNAYYGMANASSGNKYNKTICCSKRAAFGEEVMEITLEQWEEGIKEKQEDYSLY